MIIFYHNKGRITEIVSSKSASFSEVINQKITTVFIDFSKKFHEEIFVWCHENQRENLNISEIEKMFHHQKLFFSFNPINPNYLGRELGYIEDSPYIKINKNCRFGTWQMSSNMGAIHSSVISKCETSLNRKDTFDYFLNSLGKRAIVYGLFCYSEPRLSINNTQYDNVLKSNLFELFKFTKQHYKTRWIFILLFNLFIYEKRIALIPFCTSFFYKKRKFNSSGLELMPLKSKNKIVNSGTFDVVIPTIGRKDYLYDVLKNLAAQSYLPINVIIVEQNPLTNSVSELDYIQDTEWPFNIIHRFTNQAGVCNARNIAIKLIQSELVFFADDDIVFENNLLENALKIFETTGNEVFLVSCHLKSQQITPQPIKQFSVFGAGHAFIKASCLKGLQFNLAFEFGYGEDNDFGMQLRNKGYDVLYISSNKIVHLKAPIGGFRTKPVLRWENDKLLPKPSPTVMLFVLFYHTKEQLSGYKTLLFFKNLNKSFFKNPFGYIKLFRKKWDKSMYWANELKKTE